MDAINDGLNTNERTSNIKTKFYKPNDAYCGQNESEMCCRTTLINEKTTDKECSEMEDYECLLPNECDTGKETIKELQRIIFYSKNQTYHKVASSRLSWLVAHPRIFKVFMKGNFGAYALLGT